MKILRTLRGDIGSRPSIGRSFLQVPFAIADKIIVVVVVTEAAVHRE